MSQNTTLSHFATPMRPPVGAVSNRTYQTLVQEYISSFIFLTCPFRIHMSPR